MKTDEGSRVMDEMQFHNADMDAFEDALFLVDRTSMRFLHVNQAACTLHQKTRVEILDSTPSVLFETPQSDLEITYDKLIHGEVASMPTELVRPATNGKEIWLEVRRHAQRSSHGWAIVCMMRDITERKKTEAALEVSETRFRNVFEKSFTGMAIANLDGSLLEVNNSLSQLLGYTRQEMLGMNIGDITHHDDLMLERSFLQEIQCGTRNDYRMCKRYLNKSGEILWGDLFVTAIPDAHGDAVNAIGIIVDITERKRAEAELRVAAVAFESLEAMMITDAQGVIVRVNRAYTKITGYSADEAIGRTLQQHESNRHNADFYRKIWQIVARTGKWQGEVWDQRKNGEAYPKWLTISAVTGTDGAVTHYIGAQIDISERKKADKKINDLVFFDQLTGLPNRTLLLDRLGQAMAIASRSHSFGALLFIDLDNFKTLNDTRGHDIGDSLLKQVALRLSSSLRVGDTLARLGGDEFVAILKDLSANEKEAATMTQEVAEQYLAALSVPYQLGNAKYQGTASIGAVLFLGGRVAIDDLMKQADLAMYKSKTAGRNALHFFDPAMELELKERSAMEADLRRALEEKQFLLHYQAQVVDDGRVIGAEVLLRWLHPEHGMISPGNFIPLAEETRLILPIGQWVLETVCSQLAIWATQPKLANLTLAVNISARQFHRPEFVTRVTDALTSTGANPKRLKLELTETLLVENVQDIVEKMHALKSKGVGFSLDDFGTGYSSLSYLKRLPLDQLKIDQSFVRDVLIDPNDAAIARTVVALAQNLGLGVIAEGVETQAQRDFLASVGCHAYQGYFFGRPVPLLEFEAMVEHLLK